MKKILCIVDKIQEIKNEMSIDDWKILIEEEPAILKSSPDEIRDNEEVVIKAFEKEPNSLVGMSKRLKNDRVFILNLVKRNILAFNYMATNLLGDREIALESLKQKGELLHYISDELKADKEVVIEAVKNNANALYYASWDLQNDKEILSLFEKKLEKQKINYGIRNWGEDRIEALKNYQEEDKMKQDIELSAKKTVLRKF